MELTQAQKMRHLSDKDFKEAIKTMSMEDKTAELTRLKEELEQANWEEKERQNLIQTQIDNPAMEHIVDMSIAATSDDSKIPRLNVRINLLIDSMNSDIKTN